MAGLPSSTPFPLSSTAITKQNGEDDSNHYLTPSFYLEEVPANQLKLISISTFSLNEQSYCSLACKSNPPARLRVSNFPSLGLLYSVDGILLSSSNNMLYRDDSTLLFYVRYRPPWNKYSQSSIQVFDSFTAVAVDQLSGIASSAEATISIVVLPVVKPPSPLAINAAVAIANRFELISLGGVVDSLSTSYISNVTILATPASGALFQIFQDGSISNTMLFPSSQLWKGFKLAYIYT
jgi:hypothetical protein